MVPGSVPSPILEVSWFLSLGLLPCTGSPPLFGGRPPALLIGFPSLTNHPPPSRIGKACWMSRYIMPTSTLCGMEGGDGCGEVSIISIFLMRNLGPREATCPGCAARREQVQGSWIHKMCFSWELRLSFMGSNWSAPGQRAHPDRQAHPCRAPKPCSVGMAARKQSLAAEAASRVLSSWKGEQ